MSIADVTRARTTAVLLYGPAEACAASAPSLLRHVVRPLDASIFYAPPSATERDETASIRIDFGEIVPSSGLYEGHLIASAALTGEIPHDLADGSRRVLDAVASIEQAFHLLVAHEHDSGKRFDDVVIAATNLVFYTPIRPAVHAGAVERPHAEGFDPVTGTPLREPARLQYYRNGTTGDYVAGDSGSAFVDGLFVLSRDDAALLSDLSAATRGCLDEGAPAHLATILYLLLIGRAGLTNLTRSEWLVERVSPEGSAVTQLAPPCWNAPAKRKRVAVLLYGLLREYKTTANSLLRHVAEPMDASIFYFGPRHSDNPTREHKGQFDERGFFLHNPKGTFEEYKDGATPDLDAAYGERLKTFRFHNVPQQVFRDAADEFCPREDWLFMLSPHRLLSMFYNMNGAIEILREYERTSGEEFDEVIITRPDLAFYAPLKATVRPNELHITDGEGFDCNGNPYRGNARVFYYKNVLRGTYVPAGEFAKFNDQILYVSRRDLDLFGNLYEGAIKALRDRVPPSPETILYLRLVVEGGLKLVEHSDWLVEIYRADEPKLQNVADTPAILTIDPRHPKAARFRDMLSPEDRFRLTSDTAGDTGRHLLSEMLLVNGASSNRIFLETARTWLLGRARRMRRRGRLTTAQRLHARFLQLAPGDAEQWVQYGHLMKEQGDLVGAQSAYAMAVALSPYDTDIPKHIG